MYNILLVLIVSIIFNTTAIPSNYGSVGDHFEEMDCWEEDILDSNQKERNAIRNLDYRWPNHNVYYQIATSIDSNHTTRILNAMKVIENSTCVNFYPRKTYNKDYIFITGKRTGCHSPVGRRGGKQNLNLEVQSRCYKEPIICHELIHALGFFHQQNAWDRDSYIQIIEENIIPSKLFAFKKQTKSAVTDFGVGYDYDSVMHYGAYQFSANGQKPIETFNGKATIGLTIGLSEKDIRKINIMYKCKDYL